MSTESTFQLSEKAGDCIVVLRADSVEELDAAVSLFKEIGTEIVAEFSATVKAAAPVQTIKTHAGRGSQVVSPPRQGDGSQPEDCLHGPREYKSKSNDSGKKLWGGWFCTAERRNDQCEVIWDPKEKR